ncbi:MAG TPA: hypothetical protein PK640_01025 [Verrucomicrobiota bacterium]|nr:hypothetical protein [Verrucomicrobiota bacterium]
MATRAPLKILTPPQSAPATNAAAELDIRDAKPPVEIPNPWVWAAWALALLALLLGAWAAWTRWRRARTRPPSVPSVPAHVRAREKLQAALKFLSQPEPFCVAVSNALRAYLEERFDLHAPERTTEEFLLELQTSERLGADQKARLGDFLSRCDLVKFARYEPTEVELLELHAAALRLVDETEPHPLSSDAAPPSPETPPSARGGSRLESLESDRFQQGEAPAAAAFNPSPHG